MRLTPRGPAAAALVAAAILAWFLPAVVSRCFLGGDFVSSFEPLAQALRDGVQRGDILRTPRLFNGLPLLAHPVVAACYPPQHLVALMEPARALTLLSLAHLALAGAGACLLLRRLGAGAAGAVTGALAFALSGAAVSSMTQPNLVRPLAWLPWILFLTDAVARPGDSASRARRMASGLALAAVTALILLTAEPFIVLPAVTGCCALLLPRPGEAVRGHVARAARAAACAVLGALLALPLLWPGALYARESVRAAGFIPETAAVWSLHPAQVLGMLVPRPFGDPLLAGLDGFAAPLLVAGRSNEYFLSMYAGALMLGLAAAGAATGGRRERRALLGFVVLMLLALGVHGPLQPVLDALGVDWLRYPVKWVLPAMLPLALLVARGSEALGSDGVAPSRARRALFASAVCAAAVTLLSGPLAAFVASCSPDTVSAGVRDIIAGQARERLLSGSAWSAAAVLLVLLLVHLLRRQGRPALAPVAAGLVLVLDLGTQARRTVPAAEAAFYRTPAPAAQALASESTLQRAWLDLDSTRSAHPRAVPRTMRDIVAWQREILMHYTASSSGVPMAFTTDVEALAPMRIQELSELVTASAWRQRLMLLGAAGVTHVATMDDPQDEMLAPARVVPTSAGRPMRLFRNRLALPRARVVPRALLHVGSAEFARILQESPPDLFATTTIVSRPDWERFVPSASPRAETPAGWSGSARISREPASVLEIETRAGEGGGYLVVSDAWLPGTSAEVDGLPAAAFPADHAFTGVAVPEGSHVARIHYSPWGRP